MEVKKMVEEVKMDVNVCDTKLEIKERPSFWPNEWDFSQVTLTNLQESEAEKDESCQNNLRIASLLPELTITHLEDSAAERKPGKHEISLNESKLTIASLSQAEIKAEESKSTREETKVESESLRDLRCLLEAVNCELTIVSLPQSESKPEERESTGEETETASAEPDEKTKDEKASEMITTKDVEQEKTEEIWQQIEEKEGKRESRWWRKRKSIDVFEGCVQEIESQGKKINPILSGVFGSYKCRGGANLPPPPKNGW